MFNCEMANCQNKTDSLTGIYSARLTREILCCEDCHETYEDLMAYGRPDYAIAWLKNTEELLAIEEAICIECGGDDVECLQDCTVHRCVDCGHSL